MAAARGEDLESIFYSFRHAYGPPVININRVLGIIRYAEVESDHHSSANCLTVKKGNVKNKKNRLRECNHSQTLVPVYSIPQKPLRIRSRICSRVDRKTFLPPFSISFLSHLYPFRVRYQLQMLEPISTVFVTEQPPLNLPFRVLSSTQSTETRESDQSPPTYRTLPAIISCFDVTLFLTQQNSP